ncbi:aminotransferase class I/II-fold pyridoxal phosphate-dependent enzyme [Actinoplanes sp. NBC_00393]|uniref:histidinol-phosphate aminotransferase family protein n=1 Tax=Actinoplanes sp. NBC_00393 TaxID=2975953 RepID=UPI002E1A0B5C
MTRLGLRPGTAADQDWIFRLRHAVYAEELGQHEPNAAARLSDALDGLGVVYLVATCGDTPIGFVSITPPWAGRWSLDKYLSRTDLPVLDEPDVFEIRILTVDPAWRRTPAGPWLMYAALRWVMSRGGRRVVAMGRADLGGMYRAAGLRPTGREVISGAVRFEVMAATVREIQQQTRQRYASALDRLAPAMDWRLDMPMRADSDGCFHGGASFDLHRRTSVVSADVLDAWFPPAPGVLAALTDDPAWLARTSPPVDATGLRAEIATARGVPVETVTVGAGSSDLIFRAFRQWLTPDSRVLLIDPGYGEYAHVTEEVIGCRVKRLRIARAVDPGRLTAALATGGYDLAVLINPNNPTGGWLPGDTLRDIAAQAPPHTRIWVDEAYIGYVGLENSLAGLAATSPNVTVCTSMSKMYALSGLRAAYLISNPATAAALRRWTPPWALSLPAQLAAVAALRDPDYYAARWQQTVALRAELAAALQATDPDLHVDQAAANFLLVTMPRYAKSAPQVVEQCRRHGIYLRDLSPMSPVFEGRTVRIAVKDPVANARIVAAFA